MVVICRPQLVQKYARWAAADQGMLYMWRQYTIEVTRVTPDVEPTINS